MWLFAVLALCAIVQLTPPTAYDYKQVELASNNDLVAATFAWQDKVMFTSSHDGGRTWLDPRVAFEPGVIACGRHRGPRIVLGGNVIVISVVAGPKGGGADGDLLAVRSVDGGKHWSTPVRINDAANSAREGLHAMAAGRGGLIYAAWLDLRSRGTKLYGSVSTDGGATWSPNKLVYQSPSGTICQCCHPSIAIDPANDAIYVMWRNAVDGNRDLYLTRSIDRGRTFSTPEQLGVSSWKLDACPMDGGGIAIGTDGKAVTVWRRESTIFTARTGETERPVHEGRNPAIAVGTEGAYLAWTDENGLEARIPGHSDPVVLDPEGQYPQLAALSDGTILAGWERKGQIRFQRLR